MQTPALFHRMLTIGDLLDWSIRIYRARFGKLILTTAIFFVPIGIFSGILSGQMMTGYLNIIFALMQNPTASPDEQMLSVIQQNEEAFLGLSMLLAFASIATIGIVNIALTQQSIGVIHSEEVSVWSGLRTGLRRFWAWVGMNLIMGLTFFGVFLALLIGIAIVSGVIGVLAIGSIGSPDVFNNVPEAVAVAGVIVGLLCFYLVIFAVVLGPFLYFYSRWSVAIPSMVDQGLGPMASLGNSWTLTRGRVWRAIGFNLLIYLFYGVIYAAITALALGLSALVLTSSELASVIIYGIVSALLPVLWQPIQVAAHTMLYFDLRMRSEGYDVELRIRELEAEVERDHAAETATLAANQAAPSMDIDDVNDEYRDKNSA